MIYSVQPDQEDRLYLRMTWGGQDKSCYQCDKDMNLIAYFCHMKIEEAIVYCLATSNRGMRTEQIADMINRKRLHLRKDGQPVTSKQVYAVICQHRSVFCYAEGRIMLMI